MKTVTIKISGMHCAACSNGVERSLKKVPGVDRAEVNLATQSALVRYDENQATIEQLEAAVTRMSFGVVHDAPGEESTAEQRAEQDALDLKKRLKVAAFFLCRCYIWRWRRWCRVNFACTDRSGSDERCLCFCAVVVNAADIVCRRSVFQKWYHQLEKWCSVDGYTGCFRYGGCVYLQQLFNLRSSGKNKSACCA